MVKSRHIITLLTEVAKKLNCSLDGNGFRIMSDAIQAKIGPSCAISSRYLHENLYVKTNKTLKKGEDEIRVHISQLNHIANYLGYSNYDAFTLSIERPIPKKLKSCLGTWRSIVRVNSGLPILLYAPVLIYQEGQEVNIKLRGGMHEFNGLIKEVGNCAHIVMQSEGNKQLNIILKLGLSPEPKVLQGVFSGMSSNGHPIAGRELFIRAEESYEEMKWQKIDLNQAQKEETLDRRILNYFNTYEGNCLRGGEVNSFNMADLEIKKNIPL